MSDDILDGLPERLRGLACPAGEPWTGDSPESDHGHTHCWILHMAANRIEELEAVDKYIAAVSADVTSGPTVDQLKRLLELENKLKHAEQRIIATLKVAMQSAQAEIAALETLNAIDALPDEDPYNGRSADWYGGFIEAMSQVKSILHPDRKGLCDGCGNWHGIERGLCTDADGNAYNINFLVKE